MIINLKMNDDSTLCNSMIIILKEFVNHVYLNYNIDMLICKPTCEQMSIINMSEKEIYCELRNSLMTILKKINSKEKSEYFKICEGDDLEVSYNTISECIKERNVKKLNK